ncbi:biopolymer transporter ExbD [bacterium]|nr:biopolymer transporter ExbD [bacterium]
MLLDKKRAREAVIPTSSMADIAFLLLCFFLVTTSLDLDKGLQLGLPPMGEAKPIPKKNIASILINAAGEVAIDEKETPIPGIRDIIKRRLAENDKLIVSIKTARQTPYKVYIKVVDQVKMAEATKISIAEPEQ